MTKYLLLLLIIWLVWRIYKGLRQTASAQNPQGEDMVRCAVCKIYLPKRLASKGSDLVYYCPDHAPPQKD